MEKVKAQYLQLVADSWTSQVEAPDPDDEWSRGETYTSTYITGLLAGDTVDIEPLEIQTDDGGVYYFDGSLGDAVYLVVIKYSTGNTFGRSGGHIALAGAFDSSDKAEQLAEAVRKSKVAGEYGYLPWVGYFERVEDVSVEKTRILNTNE
jgi:hypothetical protein